MRAASTRMQVVAEGIYAFIKTTLLGATGDAGKPFLRLMITLFFFILMGNFMGMVNVNVPGDTGNIFHTFTAHIWITASLGFGLMIFVTGLGFYKHGLKFFTLFAPSGVAPVLLLVLVPIELISYLTRPVTLAVRLFANMMAGHALLKTIAAFPKFMFYMFGASIIAAMSTLVILLPPIDGHHGVRVCDRVLTGLRFCDAGQHVF